MAPGVSRLCGLVMEARGLTLLALSLVVLAAQLLLLLLPGKLSLVLSKSLNQGMSLLRDLSSAFHLGEINCYLAADIRRSANPAPSAPASGAVASTPPAVCGLAVTTGAVTGDSARAAGATAHPSGAGAA